MKLHDVIHGILEIPDLIAAIIENNYFQRLKSIKQLGNAYLIHPKATHTRYDHCIGTYYLANKLMDYLEINSSKLKIPELYRKCVGIAAILHDIGHGPFSHTWERISKFHHEENSWNCIDSIFKKIPYKLSENNSDHDFGIDLIKSLIIGYKDRFLRRIESEYEFLFEIVNNKQCEIDVDKWDYLKRDLYYLNVNCVIHKNYEEFFSNARVSDDRKHIEYAYKDLDKIYNLFNTRTYLHINYYQSLKNKVLENIIHEIIKLANFKNYKFFGKTITEIDSSDCEFLELTDNNVIKFLKQTNDAEILRLLDCFEGCKVEIDSNKNSLKDVPDFLQVNTRIDCTAVENLENRIHMYGDPKEKPVITYEYEPYIYLSCSFHLTD